MAQSRFNITRLTSGILLVFFLSCCQPTQTVFLSQPKDNNNFSSSNNILTVSPYTTDEEEISKALQQAIAKHEDVLTFLLNEVKIDHIEFSEDRSLALVWLSLIDLEIGEILPGEPGLAIASRLEDKNQKPFWEITLQVDPTWAKKLLQTPETLLSQEAKNWYMPNVQAIPKDHMVYTGYRLPWENGRAIRVSGSIGHVLTYKSCPSTCLYAFDFADGTIFPVLAAKGGRVKYAVWNWPNGNTEHANYLVLEDDTTSPTTFQVYFHLAQDSIPEKFRVKGAEVLQGEFIGMADDTGYSTSHHLHFHVHTNANSYWGTSVDIVFDEVKINGGRPRTCTEAANFPEYGIQCQSGNWFTSENGDRDRPTGSISQPLPNETFITPSITVRGTGNDDTGIGYIQVMATSNGEWKPVGPLLNASPFTTQINLCDAGIPNGTFFLSLQLMDVSGKLSDGVPGLIQLEKKFSCPNDPPVCLPNENQVALYSELNFHGSCALFEIGKYSRLVDFQDISNNNTDSIQIGANVMADLYTNNNWGGEKETFLNSNSDLSNSTIGVNQASSLVVALRPDIPAPPKLNSPESTDKDPIIEENDAISLSWIAEGENISYRSELTGPDGWNKSLDWQAKKVWEIGTLPAGEFSWTVWARNISGESQSSLNFTVHKQDLPSVTEMVSINDALDSTAVKLQWIVLEGEKDLAYFDIQMCKDGAPWTDWQTALDANTRETRLIGAPGSTYGFRIRSVDQAGNIEAFPEKAEIKLKMPLNCTADEFEDEELSDNRWNGATQLELNHNQVHNLCGQQDIDWVHFSAENGASYRILLEPVSEGASVSASLFGMDHDLVLSEAKPLEPGGSTEIKWTAPDSGIYSLRITGSDPNLFGSDTQYQVRIDKTAQLQPTTYLWSTLLLPLIWAVIKAFSRLKARFDPADELPF